MAEIESIAKLIKKVSKYYSKKDEPSEEHSITYDSGTAGLEPVYFWVLDMMNNLFSGKVEKLVDNFSSTPGSGHFAELETRAYQMQTQAKNLLDVVNVVVKSVINIIYDLKEFEIRLSQYTDANSNDKERAEGGLLALKQIWMDNVDIKKGNSSIKALSLSGLNQPNFVTLIDGFLAANSVKDVEKMDLNERVKRILKPRVAEFLEWKKRSEIELRKRYEIEKSYLRTQVNSIKMYSRWAKPYLRAASSLEMKEYNRKPELVNAFSTLFLELAIFGKNELKIINELANKNLPVEFKRLEKKKSLRKYFSCVLVDFTFRGIPQKLGQHYSFGGRVEVSFKGYSLNEQELAALNEELKKDDFNVALELVQGLTDDSLEQLREDLNYYLEEGSKESPEEESIADNVNPFLALVGLGEKKTKKDKKDKSDKKEEKAIPPEKIKPDTYEESMIRSLAEQSAKSLCFKVFDVYKKAHGMASHPDPYEYWIEPDV